MRIFGYSIGCGDFFRLEFIGDSGQKRNVFIDSGFERTYRQLIALEIKKIQEEGANLDLWIISHFHDDHIGGSTGYVKAVNAGHQVDLVKKWWFNSPRTGAGLLASARADISTSIKQAELLSSFLSKKGDLHKNDVHNALPAIIIDGLEIHVLSPTSVLLSEIEIKYKNPTALLETQEQMEVDRAISAKIRDYHIPADDFNLERWNQDANLENAGSIALIASFKGKKFLFLADSHPNIVEEKFISCGYSTDNQLQCELVKVSHHGSAGNNSPKLYSLISCNRYVIPCDGVNKYGLPQKSCMLQILKNPGRDKSVRYYFYLTSDDNLLRSIFEIDGDDIFADLNFEIILIKAGSHFIYDF